jgi:serine/threonine protein phosphatase PrpC
MMMRPQLSVSIGHCSIAGRKAANQDFCGFMQPEGPALVTKGIALAVADGISTSGLGATASETAVKTFLEDYYCTSEAWSAQSSAERVIAAANSWMHAQNGRPLTDEERERGLICTFSALVLKSRSAHLFHVGDGRIARLRDAIFEPLTEAHRVSIGGGESYLGRALGLNRHVEIDHRHLPMEPGDLFVLTTDGVHDHLADASIADLITASEDLGTAAAKIVEAAQEAGSGDNLTVLLARIDGLPEGAVDDLLGSETTLPPAPILTPGGIFEGYEILRQIHAGSRSHVYLARDESGQTFALKVLSTEHSSDPAHLRALLLEEWVARRIDNPHVLKSTQQHRPRRYIFAASEHIEGQTLAQWMADHPSPELTQVRSFVAQIAAGLLAFHRREMLHRDLRPQNVMVDSQGTAKIIDFGSVQVAGLDEVAPREVEDSAFVGTLQYASPELFLGHPATAASDLYSLGVIAYQMLTGRLPYGPRVSAATTRAAQRRLRYAPAADHNPAVPDWMDAAIAKAVSTDPAARYTLLSEFTYDLSHPNPSLTAPHPQPLLARHPVRTWQAISAILFGLLLVSVFAA